MPEEIAPFVVSEAVVVVVIEPRTERIDYDYDYDSDNDQTNDAGLKPET